MAYEMTGSGVSVANALFLPHSRSNPSCRVSQGILKLLPLFHDRSKAPLSLFDLHIVDMEISCLLPRNRKPSGIEALDLIHRRPRIARECEDIDLSVRS